MQTPASANEQDIYKDHLPWDDKNNDVDSCGPHLPIDHSIARSPNETTTRPDTICWKFS